MQDHDLITPDFTRSGKNFSLRGIAFEENRLGLGTGMFEYEGAAFQNDADASGIDPFHNAILCEMTPARFLRVGDGQNQKAIPLFNKLKVPTLLVKTDDERNSCFVSAAGGLREAKTFEACSSSTAKMPVILFVENNGKLVEIEDFNNDLQNKLNKGLYPIGKDGDIKTYLVGKSFAEFYPPVRLNFTPGFK